MGAQQRCAHLPASSAVEVLVTEKLKSITIQKAVTVRKIPHSRRQVINWVRSVKAGGRLWQSTDF